MTFAIFYPASSATPLFRCLVPIGVTCPVFRCNARMQVPTGQTRNGAGRIAAGLQAAGLAGADGEPWSPALARTKTAGAVTFLMARTCRVLESLIVAGDRSVLHAGADHLSQAAQQVSRQPERAQKLRGGVATSAHLLVRKSEADTHGGLHQIEERRESRPLVPHDVPGTGAMWAHVNTFAGRAPGTRGSPAACNPAALTPCGLRQNPCGALEERRRAHKAGGACRSASNRNVPGHARREP